MVFLVAAEVKSLKERFIHETPPLTEAEVSNLRLNMGPDEWTKLQRQKSGEYETEAETLAKSPTLISAGRTDQQIAQDIRADLQARLEAISEIMTKAKREHGLTVNFGFSPPDSFGRVSLAVLEISKKLC